MMQESSHPGLGPRSPRGLCLHADDNVAVVLADTRPGPIELLLLGSVDCRAVVAKKAIAQGHKIVLRPIDDRVAVVKCGIAIGFTMVPIAAGSQMILFTTGRSSVIGAPVAPLVNITGDSETYRKLAGEIDFDAGRLLAGECTLDELADELTSLVVKVARGELTKPERLGHREYVIPYKHQDTPPLEIGCRS